MEQPKITRNVIHIISRYSNWSEKGIENYLKVKHIYADKTSWSKFIDILLLSLGAAFSLAGIILFFAYNWHNLHKFFKIGLTEGLLIVLISLVAFTKFKPIVKNILLASASIMVGVLFSVFGQIYQTGADAYDFFLGWTVFIIVWALISDFAVLWFILTILINTTFVLYINQAGPYLSTTLLCLILFILNTLIIVFTTVLRQRNKIANLPGWFNKALGFAAVTCITVSLMSGIFDHYPVEWFASLGITLLIFAAGITYSYKQRNLFYLCVIPLSVIIVCSTLLAEIMGSLHGFTYFMISIFILISITAMVIELVKLTKKWNGIN